MAKAYSATTVFPAEVCAATSTLWPVCSGKGMQDNMPLLPPALLLQEGNCGYPHVLCCGGGHAWRSTMRSVCFKLLLHARCAGRCELQGV